jgi:hypothetical protein
MTYRLHFAINLERKGNQVIYNPSVFADRPVVISVPGLIEILKQWIKDSEPVDICEYRQVQASQYKSTGNPEQENKNIYISKNQANVESITNVIKIGQAYILKQNEIDIKSLNILSEKLVEYINDCISNINKNNIFLSDSGIYFSTLAEINNFRNYINLFVKEPKKIYKDGYVYLEIG